MGFLYFIFENFLYLLVKCLICFGYLVSEDVYFYILFIYLIR